MAFSYKRAITVDNTGGSAQSNFQCLLTLSSSNFTFANAQTNGEDIRFYADEARTTPISHWIQAYDSGAETASIWVEVPSVPSDDTTTIWMYFGDAGLNSGSDIKNTFLVGDDFSDYNVATVFGTGPIFMTDTCKIGSTIYGVAFNSSTFQHQLWKTIDNGASWSVQKEILASSSGRTHPFCDTDGTDIYISYKIDPGTGAGFKKYTVGTDTLGSEKTITSDAVTDPKVLYVSGSLLLCFYATGSTTIKCYQSADDGDTWSLRSTPETGGSHSIEDVEAIVAANGDILLAWEREEAEKGEAYCEQRISDDDGSTWGSKTTIVDNVGADDEGGNYCLDVDGDIGNPGDLFYVYGSDKDTGTSYDKNQLFRLKSTDNGATWGSEEKIWEPYSLVEPCCEIDGDGRMLITGTKQYNPSGTTSSVLEIVSFHAVESTDTDWTDNGWESPDEGIFFTELVGSEQVCRTEGIVWDTGRGYMPHADVTGGDYIIECDVRSANTNRDPRLSFGYQDEGNNYLLEFFNTSSIVYRRVSGAFTQLSTSGITHNSNTWYPIKIAFFGSGPTTIQVTFNGTLENNFTDSTYDSGKVALGAATAANRLPTYVRNYRVRKYAAVEPALSAGAEQPHSAGSVVRARSSYLKHLLRR